jgi:hypothetical protein
VNANKAPFSSDVTTTIQQFRSSGCESIDFLPPPYNEVPWRVAFRFAKELGEPAVRELADSSLLWSLILAPLALYFLYVGIVLNSQRRPVVLTGPQDQLRLFLGLAGFFLVGPPTWILSSFQRYGSWGYWCFYLLYLFALAMFQYSWLRRRARSVVVYNVDPYQFVDCLNEVLGASNIPHATTPERISFNDGRTLLDLDVSFAFYNVTYTWRGQDHFDHLGTLLAEKVRQVESAANPGGVMLASIGTMLSISTGLGLALWFFLTRM